MQTQHKFSESSFGEASRPKQHDESLPADLILPPMPQVIGAHHNTGSTPSPAHALQNQITKAFAEPIVENRWSPRRTTAFLISTCGLFWGSVIWGLLQFFG